MDSIQGEEYHFTFMNTAAYGKFSNDIMSNLEELHDVFVLK